jgi:hypothetical protein
LGVNFFCVVEVRFCWGFCENWSAERGFFVVKMWSIRGELWWLDGRVLAGDFFPLF